MHCLPIGVADCIRHIASLQLSPNHTDRRMSAENEHRIMQLAIPHQSQWDRPFILGNTNLAATPRVVAVGDAPIASVPDCCVADD
jgi:hypothetical protein